MLSLIIARYIGRMQGASIDYALKDTRHTDWDFSGAHRILHSQPKWQGQSGQIFDLCGGSTVTGGSSAAAGTGGSLSNVHIAGDDSPEHPYGRKRAKNALFQSQAVAGAMSAVSASVAASASSISKSAYTHNERNGIMVFAGKVDAKDIEASELFALKRKLHMQKARSEIWALSPVASAGSTPLSRPSPDNYSDRPKCLPTVVIRSTAASRRESTRTEIYLSEADTLASASISF
jgi:hypothetical protein